MGGDCLNTGCVPSKALIAAAKHARRIAQAPAVRHRGAGAAGRLRATSTTHVHERDRRDRAERFDGALHRPRRARDRRRRPASRTSAPSRSATSIEIRARRFVIATGSPPAVPPIPGLADTPYLTNETVFDLTSRPAASRSSSAPGRSGSSWRRRSAGSAPRSRCWKPAQPLARDDPECAARRARRAGARGRRHPRRYRGRARRGGRRRASR